MPSKVAAQIRRALSSEFPKQALIRLVKSNIIDEKYAKVAYENKFGRKLEM